MNRSDLACVLAATLLAACEREEGGRARRRPRAAPQHRARDAASAESGTAAQRRIVEAYYDKFLELNPLQATFIDDHRYDDRLANDIGPEMIAKSLALEKEYLDRCRRSTPNVLSDQDRLTYEIFLRDRRTAIEGFDYPGELIPINQFFSLPNFFAQLGSGSSVQPFATYEDYQHFLGRARDFAVWMDQAIANMKQGVERGVVQPRVVIEKTIPQLEAQITDDWTKSLFHRPHRVDAREPHRGAEGASSRLHTSRRSRARSFRPTSGCATTSATSTCRTRATPSATQRAAERRGVVRVSREDDDHDRPHAGRRYTRSASTRSRACTPRWRR